MSYFSVREKFVDYCLLLANLLRCCSHLARNSASGCPPPAPKSTTFDSEGGTGLGVDGTNTCVACSMSNDAKAIVCIACSNVLKPAQMPNHWRCTSDACIGVYASISAITDDVRCAVLPDYERKLSSRCAMKTFVHMLTCCMYAKPQP
jgi:hypothetical protein